MWGLADALQVKALVPSENFLIVVRRWRNEAWHAVMKNLLTNSKKATESIHYNDKQK